MNHVKCSYNNIIKKAWFIPLIITGISLYKSIWYALIYFEINSDSLREYNTFFHYYTIGKWCPLIDNMLSSSLMTTYFPSVLARIAFFVSPETIYRLSLGGLVAILPVVIYWLVSKYTNKINALILTFFFYTSYYYVDTLAMIARMQVAVIFCALLLIAFKTTNKYRYIFIVVSSIGICISHYSTAYVWLIVTGIMLLWCVVAKFKKKDTILLAVSIAFITILLTTSIFYPLSGSAPNKYAATSINKVLDEINIDYQIEPLIIKLPSTQEGTPEYSKMPDYEITDQDTIHNSNTGVDLSRVLIAGHLVLLCGVLYSLIKRGYFFRIETIGLALFIGISSASLVSETIIWALGSLRPSYMMIPLELSAIALWLGKDSSSYKYAYVLIPLSLIYH